MTVIVYSETTAQNIEARLGKSEYSYYFVLKEYLPVLKTMGSVVIVTDPAREVDPIFRKCRKDGEDCVFLSFTPPHLTELGLECPTIPVFAWEFDTIPSETWFGEREQDWRYPLDKLGKAITHSATTVRTIKNAMGTDFPIVSAPAPVWDRYASKYEPGASPIVPAGTRLSLAGTTVDSRSFDFSQFAGEHWHANGLPPTVPLEHLRNRETTIELDGVVYLTVFNPGDGRKNWHDLVAGFCWAFRNTADATLILKLTSSEYELPLAWILEFIYRLAPFKCRVILLTGFLQSEQYESLIKAASYIVNTSHGEGQCLPLMEGMARGKPVIAPRHTGMTDYVDPQNAFIVRSSAAPTLWPHDPRIAFRTLHQRIDFESVVAAYRESYRVAKTDPARYGKMAEQARESMRHHASAAVVAGTLQTFLWSPARPAGPDDRYGRIAMKPDASCAV